MSNYELGTGANPQQLVGTGKCCKPLGSGVVPRQLTSHVQSSHQKCLKMHVFPSVTILVHSYVSGIVFA